VAQQSDLDLAQHLADLADEVTLRRFRACDLLVATKPDHTPVTDADTAVEDLVRAHLAVHRPGDAVLGEEEGLVAGDGSTAAAGQDRRWVLDPIDGTKSYARGVPVWATLLSLEVHAVPQVAVVSAPALGRRWWAVRGEGAHGRDLAGEVRRLRVSGVGDPADASLSYSSLSGWQDLGLLPGFLALCDSMWRTRAYGDFWSHVMVAEGLVDLAAEPVVNRWDLSAVALLVTEAGGRFTGLDGVDGPGQGSALASNSLLHGHALAHLGIAAPAT
jgi:histidinol-phosphatase